MAFRDLSEVSIGSGDRDLLAAIIQCEAGGEPYAGKIAVGAVVMNRVMSGAFPNTIAGVVYQPMQFQPVRSGRLAIRLAEGANSTCYKAADEVLAGANNIGNCLFFRTVVPGIKGTIIGHHVFYLYWTGVASGYGTVEESLEGDASGSKKEHSKKRKKPPSALLRRKRQGRPRKRARPQRRKKHPGRLRRKAKPQKRSLQSRA